MKTIRLRSNHVKNKSKYRFKRKKKKMFVAEFTGVGFKAVSDYLVEEAKTAGHLFDASYTSLNTSLKVLRHLQSKEDFNIYIKNECGRYFLSVHNYINVFDLVDIKVTGMWFENNNVYDFYVTFDAIVNAHNKPAIYGLPYYRQTMYSKQGLQYKTIEV